MRDIDQEDTIMQNKFIVFCLFIVICLNIYFSSVGFFNPLLEHYAFRQTQTAISAYYYLKEGFTLNYITPVLGAPWSIPFEFPTYQFIVAGFSYLTTIPLEAAGRLISIIFFYLALGYIYKILSLYFFDKILRLIPIIFLLVCPQYIFWSRTFMIESTALFFVVGHFYYLLKLKQEICFRAMVLCLLFGALGRFDQDNYIYCGYGACRGISTGYLNFGDTFPKYQCQILGYLDFSCFHVVSNCNILDNLC